MELAWFSPPITIDGMIGTSQGKRFMNLRSGSLVIKLLLVACIVVSSCGLAASLLPNVAEQLPPHFMTMIFALDVIILVLVLWIYTKRKLGKRVNILAKALERGADGDLTVRVPAEDDEIGQLGNNLNTMLWKLGEFVDRVNGSLRELRTISLNTTGAAEQLVDAAETQSAAVKETATAVAEIIASIDSLSREIDTLAQSASQNAGAISSMSTSLDVVGGNIDTQSKAIEEVSSSIIQVAAAVKQIAGSVNSLMGAATTTATSVADMDSSIKQVEQNAQEAASITEAVRSDALFGQETVAATISGIGEIRQSTQITFDAIGNLSNRVKAIGNILLVIDDLAEQTNLLALNSAIIAAQAGEHGKGFAVVADQIKGLATRTRNSTQEIAALITAIQKETQQAVNAIKTTEKKVADGVLLSQKSGDALQKIVSGMEDALRQVHDIAEATVEQAQGSQQIRQAMGLISDMVSQIAKSTREQGITSELIIAAADRLRELTDHVRSSSIEQSSLGLEIAESTGKMSGIIRQVERLRTEQAQRSLEIRRAIQEVDKATEADLAVVRIMEEGVERLSRQIAFLQSEMANLRIQE